MADGGGAWFDIVLSFPVGRQAVTARFKDALESKPLATDMLGASSTLEVLRAHNDASGADRAARR